MAHLTNSDTDRPCPKCGFEQAHGRECIACGVDFAEFNARWEASKAESPSSRSPTPAARPPAAPPAAPNEPAVTPPPWHQRPMPSWLALPIARRTASEVCAALGDLLQAGVGTHEALTLLANNARGRLQQAIDAIAERVDHGAPLSEAMAKAPALFFPADVLAVTSAERYRAAGAALHAIADAVHERLELRSQLFRSMTYPLLMLVLHAVLSHIPLLLDSIDEYTAAVVGDLSLLALACVVLAVGPSRLMRLRVVSGPVRTAGWWLPWPFGMYAAHARAVFCKALARNLATGMDELEALRCAAAVTGDPVVLKRAERAEAAMVAGETLGQQLWHAGLIARREALLAVAAERAGILPETLHQLSERYSMARQRGLKLLLLFAGGVLTIVLVVVVALSAAEAYRSILDAPADILRGIDIDPSLFPMP